MKVEIPDRYRLYPHLIPEIPDRYVLPATHFHSALALAEGTKLLGRYESPGMTDERYLVRRNDGQVVLLTLVLYLIASGLDAHRSLGEIADELTERLGQTISPETVTQVIDIKLAPLGILAETDEPVAPTNAPLMSLTMKGTLFTRRQVRSITRAFSDLYVPLVVAAYVFTFVVCDTYLFGFHGVSSTLAAVAARPLSLLPVFGLVVASVIFHEIGHATACRYGGGRPGRIGFGIYLVFPAFYTDVTDTYRLTRWARVRTDLGGVYFNAISVVFYTVAFIFTGYQPLVPAIVFIHLMMLEQMLPLVRLDGYYVLSDLVGVPDLYGRIRPIMRSLLPGHSDPAAARLNPAARRIVAVWVLIAVPAMAFGFATFIWHLPQLARDTIDNLQVQWSSADHSLDHHQWVAFVAAVISVVLLCIPALGMSAFLVRLTRRIPRRRTHEHQGQARRSSTRRNTRHRRGSGNSGRSERQPRPVSDGSPGAHQPAHRVPGEQQRRPVSR